MKDEGDSRLFHGYDSGVLTKRAQHDLVVIENIRMGSRTVAARVVVAPDRRVIADLEEDGLWGAYKAISEAIKIRTQGLGARSFDPSRVNGQSSGVEVGADLLIQYDRWYKLCQEKYLAPLLVRKMIIDGISLNGLDKEYKFYKGSSKLKVWKCLRLWDEV